MTLLIDFPQRISEAAFKKYFSLIPINLVPESQSHETPYFPLNNPLSIIFVPTSEQEVLEIISNKNTSNSTGNHGIATTCRKK